MTRFVLTAAFASGLLFTAAPTQAAARCAPVQLAVSGGSKAFTTAFALKSKAFRATSVNFAKAYAKACADGLLKTRNLPSRVVLLNAPDANVASIYKSGGRTVIEYWFFGHDGRAHVPNIDELREAIFCDVRGATQAEQEESGRCLPD